MDNKKFDFLVNYGTEKYRLCEGMFDRDMNGWINIGVIKNGSNLGSGGDAYLMANPNYPKSDDFSDVRYRGTGYNSKPDGSGTELTLSSYKTEDLEIYPQYRDTYYGELFLGKMKTEEDEQKHKEFMSRLNYTADGNVMLTHNSSYRIEDGVVRRGQPNRWSNNSDFGIYFWASKNQGNDLSGSGRYTYFCEVSPNDIYDFENNLERFISLNKVFTKYKYAAQEWKNGNAIVANAVRPTPITAIKDNMTGKCYNTEWNEIQFN